MLQINHQVEMVIRGKDHHAIGEIQRMRKVIENMVRDWICKTAPKLEKQNTFTLEVECARIPTHPNWSGVEAINIPKFNPCAIVMRIMPPSWQKRFRAILICENSNIANYLIKCARPDAYEYLRLSQQIDSLRNSNFVQKTHENRTADSEIGSTLKENDKHYTRARAVLKKGNIELFCLGIESALNCERTLDRELIKEIASKVVSVKELSDYGLSVLLHSLVYYGYLNPNKVDPTRFVKTNFLVEAANEAYKKQLNLILKDLNKQQSQLEEKLQRAHEKQHTAYRESLKASQDIAEAERQICENWRELDEYSKLSESLLN